MRSWITFISLIFHCLLLSAHVSATGGQCYSRAQASCRDQWTKLVVAQGDNQNGKVCRYFGDVHTCTLKYMSNCKFEKHEQELYHKDIVGIYTHKPYSCALIGGNLEFKGEYQGSGTSVVTASILLLPILLLINSIFYT